MAMSETEKRELLRGLLEQLPEDKLLEFVERMQEAVPPPPLYIERPEHDLFQEQLWWHCRLASKTMHGVTLYVW